MACKNQKPAAELIEGHYRSLSELAGWTHWMRVRHCVALPLTFHFGVQVNRLDQPHWMHDSHFSHVRQAWLLLRFILRFCVSPSFTAPHTRFSAEMDLKMTCSPPYCYHASISMLTSISVEYFTDVKGSFFSFSLSPSSFRFPLLLCKQAGRNHAAAAAATQPVGTQTHE